MAIVDLFSKNFLSWKLSNSLDTEFCLDALEIALAGNRKPEIFNSDQVYQFTFGDFVAKPQTEEIKINWSSIKHCHDNILMERLWRTVKYVAEASRRGRVEVDQHAYNDDQEAEISLARLPWRHCLLSPHTPLGGRTSHDTYNNKEQS